MKIIAILALAVILTGCNPRNGHTASVESRKANIPEDYFVAVCLDGVEYWMRETGHLSYLAPRIDPETLMPARCELQP